MRGKVMALKNLVDEVQTLQFWEDPTLEDRITELDRVLSLEAKNRPPDDFQRALRALGAQARLVLLEIDRPPARSGRDFDIPDDLPSLTRVVRRGGRSLELTDPSDMPDIGPLGRTGSRSPALAI